MAPHSNGQLEDWILALHTNLPCTNLPYFKDCIRSLHSMAPHSNGQLALLPFSWVQIDDRRARESRVVVTMNGKFLPYNEQRLEENIALGSKKRSSKVQRGGGEQQEQ